MAASWFRCEVHATRSCLLRPFRSDCNSALARIDDSALYTLRVRSRCTSKVSKCCTVVRNKFWRFGLIAAVRSAPKKNVEVTQPDSNSLVLLTSIVVGGAKNAHRTHQKGAVAPAANPAR